MLFYRRRRKTLMCLAGLSAVLFCVVQLGTMTGHSGHGPLALLTVQGRELFHKSSANGPSIVLTMKAKEQQMKEEQEAFSKLMSERKLQVLTGCQSHVPNPRYLQSKIPIVNKDQGFLHCPLTKAASTFWGRFLLTLNMSGPMKSPFFHQLKVNKPIPRTPFVQLGSQQERLQFLDRSFSSLFVRDPYHRMFSAYVDKILGPNPYFWKEWGSQWRRISRRPLPRRADGAVCYHQVTFSQVMSVAAAKFYKTEMHFVPASVWCSPCEFRYQFIGKMETFAQDLRHLTRHLNLSLTDYFSSRQFAFDYAKDAIEDSINSPFGWLKDVTRCISKYEMGLRIWRKLQIRGLVDRRILFPYSSEQFQAVTSSEMIAAALQAHRNSTDREELRQQKRQAFLEAYRTVDTKVLETLRDAFRDDFVMFGYDSSPRDVFDRSQPLNLTGSLDWSVPWMAKERA